MNARRLAMDRFFANVEFFFRWHSTLVAANQGKVGRPFRAPAAFYEFLALARARCGLDYRTLGRAAAIVIETTRPRLAATGMGDLQLQQLRAPHFTQIRRRVDAMMLDAKTVARLASDEPVHVILDEEKAAVATRSEWSRTFISRRLTRGWVPIPLSELASQIPGPLGQQPA